MSAGDCKDEEEDDEVRMGPCVRLISSVACSACHVKGWVHTHERASANSQLPAACAHSSLGAPRCCLHAPPQDEEEDKDEDEDKKKKKVIKVIKLPHFFHWG